MILFNHHFLCLLQVLIGLPGETFWY